MSKYFSRPTQLIWALTICHIVFPILSHQKMILFASGEWASDCARGQQISNSVIFSLLACPFGHFYITLYCIPLGVKVFLTARKLMTLWVSKKYWIISNNVLWNHQCLKLKKKAHCDLLLNISSSIFTRVVRHWNHHLVAKIITLIIEF